MFRTVSLIVSVVVGIGVGIVFWRNKLGLASSILSSLIVGMLALLGFMGIGSGINTLLLPHETYVENTKSEEIVALKDSTQIKGEFKGNFLNISGSLTSNLTYTFFVVNSDGSYASRQISDDGNGAVSIFEFEKKEMKPLYKVFHEVEVCTAPEWTHWISPCSDIPKYSREPVKWEIYVPKGTIVMNMSIDLE